MPLVNCVLSNDTYIKLLEYCSERRVKTANSIGMMVKEYLDNEFWLTVAEKTVKPGQYLKSDHTYYVVSNPEDNKTTVGENK